MSDPYQDYLKAFHAGLQLADGPLERALRAVSSAPVTSRTRIVAGEANEVYDVAFADGLDVIVRISRDRHKHFEQERWAIRQCRERGVPVPEILSIEHLSADEAPLDICIQRKIEGRRLSDLTSLPREDLKAILAKAGDLLSRVHTVPTTGLGYIDGEGRGESPTFGACMAELEESRPAYEALAVRTGFDAGAMVRLLDLLCDGLTEDLYSTSQVFPCLIHNDFRACHLLVMDGHITGLIDWGEASSDTAVNDFAKWDFKDGEAYPLAWIKAGYADKSLFDDGFERLLPLLKLMQGLCSLQWYDWRGYAQGVAEAKAGLGRLLREDFPRE